MAVAAAPPPPPTAGVARLELVEGSHSALLGFRPRRVRRHRLVECETSLRRRRTRAGPRLLCRLLWRVLLVVVLTPVGPRRAQADVLAGRTPQTQTRPDAKPVSPNIGWNGYARVAGKEADVYDPMVTFLAAECPGVTMYKTEVAPRSRRDARRVYLGRISRASRLYLG